MDLLKHVFGKKETQVNVEVNTKESDFVKCPKCGQILDKQRVVNLKYVCYKCGSYFRVKTSNRIRMIADNGTFTPLFEGLPNSNPLDFEGYEEKIKEAREKTGLDEALTVGKCQIYGEDAIIGICDSRFLMSSMGHVVGEKLTLAIEKAIEERLPVFVFCCSGGARMQEGIVSLMQMAKTSAAISRMAEEGLLYSTILTDPTTGGVTASFAMLGDVILAEPKALVGFAGPRVIRQTIGQELPEGFQTSEFVLEHGFVDAVVERKDLKKTLYFLIKSHKSKEGNYADFDETDSMYRISEIVNERYHKAKPKTAWEKVREVRQAYRPQGADYIEHIFDVFLEAHGDRAFRDDPSIIGGIGFIGNQPITVISEDKGKTPTDFQKKNFGMPMPEGYRKALRLMKQAEKFNRPIVCFVNTPGAYPGMDAEERGMGESIARNLLEMAKLTVPVLCILVGEGGSGGALAIAVGNEVWMLENATYAILSPEGFASILWKDSNRAEEASEVMKITADDLKALNVIEKIIPEFGGADDVTKVDISHYMKKEICTFLEKYTGFTKEQIKAERLNRFRAF